MSKIFLTLFFSFSHFIFFFIKCASAADPISNSTSGLAVYKIGVMMPDASYSYELDIGLTNIILTTELAIQYAAEEIKKRNILQDVELQFVRYFSDPLSIGNTTLSSVRMIDSGIDAVVGDIVSSMSEPLAGISGFTKTPQCSFASSSYTLSDKKNYPYFFRTVVSASVYGTALTRWAYNMNWKSLNLIFSDDLLGQRVVNIAAAEAAELSDMDILRHSLSFNDDYNLEAILKAIIESDVRIVAMTIVEPEFQMKVMRAAYAKGMFSKGWAWLFVNDIVPILANVSSQIDLSEYNGLMYMSEAWNLSGQAHFDNLNSFFQLQPVPDLFRPAEEWNEISLAFNAPQAYSCVEILALGLDKALDMYPGGRSNGLADLRSNNFNSTIMKPEFYNMNYTGPIGSVDFTETGDLRSGNFEMKYILNGKSITYAKTENKKWRLDQSVNIIYLGNTQSKPRTKYETTLLNPTTKRVTGIIIIIISTSGLICTFTTFILIFWYRDLKPILISSPLFCYMQLLGISMGYTSLLLYLGTPNAAICVGRQFLTFFGFSLVIGSIIAKNYRIYRIFQNVFAIHTSKLKSRYLLRFVIVSSIIGSVPLIVWNSLYPSESIRVRVTVEFDCFICTYPDATVGNWLTVNAADVTIMIWGACMITVAAILAFKTRHVNQKWSETSQIAYVTYAGGLTSLVACSSFFIPVSIYQLSILIKAISIMFGSTFTLCIIFVPKVTYIVKYMMKNSTTLNIYRMNSSSQSNLTKPIDMEFYEDAANQDLVAKNLLDFSMKAHEGILPVKKLAKFGLFSIWELRHVILVPAKKYFILSNNKNGKEVRKYNYIKCEAIPTSATPHFFFCVHTDEGMLLKFQVGDKNSLDRWIGWFSGIEVPQTTPEIPDNREVKVPNKIPQSVSTDQVFSSPRNIHSSSFDPTDSSLAHASSSFYFKNPKGFYQHPHLSYIDNEQSGASSSSQNLTPRHSNSHKPRLGSQVYDIDVKKTDDKPTIKRNSFELL